MHRTYPAAFLLALAILTFLPFVGFQDITTSHEARVVQVARQMAEAGWPWNSAPVSVPRPALETTAHGKRLKPAHDESMMRVNPWIVPVINGQVRLQKPPLPYWCTAILYRIFGFSEFASRIIPALMAAGSVVLVWDLSRRFASRLIAWYAGLVWVSTFFIVDESRKAMADPYLAFFTLVAMWACVRGGTMRWRMTFYVALALGILSKGPVIFLFIVPFALYHALGRSNPPAPDPLPDRGDRIWGHIAGVLIMVLMTLPWLVAVLQTVPNAAEVWRYESVGALGDKVEDVVPWWYYGPNLLQNTLPWTPVWLLGLWVALRARQRRRRVGAICTLIVIVIFSCANGKKGAYLLPLAPLICLVAGQGLAWLSAHRRLRPAGMGIHRLTLLAAGFSILIQMILGIDGWRGNRGSSRDAARHLTGLLAESNRRSILISRLPEDATPYFPLGLRDSATSDEVYVLLDDRKGLADQMVEKITETPAGPVVVREFAPIPDSTIMRWRIYRLTISPIQRAAPGAG